MLSPLLQFAIVALGSVAALALFVSLKREVRAQARKNNAQLDRMREEIERQAQAAAQRPEPEDSPGAAPVALRSGMNMSKRTQALRLLRRGEDVSHVCAALGASRREIELLIRVQKLSAQRATAAK